MTRPHKETAEFLSFVAQALGWKITRADAYETQMVLYLAASPVPVPDSIRKRAANSVATIYKEAIREALLQVVTGSRLQVWMEQRGVTVADLEAKSTVSAATIRKCLEHKTTPREETARKLYNAMLNKLPDQPVGWHELASMLQ